MKSGILIALLFSSIQLGKHKSEQKIAVYHWLGYETIVKNRAGKLTSPLQWNNPHFIGAPGDTFVIYGKYDSVLMKVPGVKKGDLFKKTAIASKTWKPVMQYGKFVFIGTYTVDRLPGLYFSYYATKDYGSLMQLHYTNPGNLTDVLVFSKDSVNILQKDQLIIDPQNEIQEAELLQLQNQLNQ